MDLAVRVSVCVYMNVRNSNMNFDTLDRAVVCIENNICY